MKTLKQVASEHGFKVNKYGWATITDDELLVIAKDYASQFIDEAANQYIPDDNPKIFRDKILKLKQDLK